MYKCKIYQYLSKDFSTACEFLTYFDYRYAFLQERLPG